MSKSSSKKGNKTKSSSKRILKNRVRSSTSVNTKKRIWKHQGR